MKPSHHGVTVDRRDRPVPEPERFGQRHSIAARRHQPRALGLADFRCSTLGGLDQVRACAEGAARSSQDRNARVGIVAELDEGFLQCLT